jgi:predicted Co/Zn/Cd cation transporter (cation efflux family)
MISGAVAVAFLAVVLLEGTRFAGWLPYADPVVVVALAILSAPIPLRIIRENWGQLLGRAPDPDLQREARTRVDDALRGVPGVTPHLRMLETGRTFYLQLYLVIDPASGPQRLADLDELRARIHRTVTKDTPEVGLDVIFTRQPRWAGAANPTGSDRNAATDRGA